MLHARFTFRATINVVYYQDQIIVCDGMLMPRVCSRLLWPEFRAAIYFRGWLHVTGCAPGPASAGRLLMVTKCRSATLVSAMCKGRVFPSVGCEDVVCACFRVRQAMQPAACHIQYGMT